MEASYYIGIDIGKHRLDWHVNDAQNTALTTGQAANTLTWQVADLSELNDQMQAQNDQLTTLLKQVDRKILSLLCRYNTTEGQYDLLVSIPGIGPIIAGWLLVYTEGFTGLPTLGNWPVLWAVSRFPSNRANIRAQIGSASGDANG